MKKFTRIALMICLTAMIMGTAACAVSISLGFSSGQFKDLVVSDRLQRNHFFWNKEKNSNERTVDEGSGNDWKKDSYTFRADTIDKLDIEFLGGDLSFQETDGESIDVTIAYKERLGKNQNRITCKAGKGTLEIDDETAYKRNNVRFADITIKIPKEKNFKKIELKTGAGTSQIDYAFHAGEMDIELGAGELVFRKAVDIEEELSLDIGAGRVQMEQLTAKKTDLKCGVGKGSFTQMDVKEIRVDCGIGTVDIKVPGRQADYDYKLKVGLGYIAVGNESYSGLAQSKKIKNKASKKVDIECGMGSVNLGFTDTL